MNGNLIMSIPVKYIFYNRDYDHHFGNLFIYLFIYLFIQQSIFIKYLAYTGKSCV